MKEYPILFSTPMVQAILAGEKTQTRRIITKHRSGPCGSALKKDLDWNSGLMYINNPFGIKLLSKIDSTVHRVYPPYNPGDHLWVKETFKPLFETVETGINATSELVYRCVYKADKQTHGPWRPSIFMPRHASRITLEVESVHVESLQDITEEDAIAEGVGYGFQMNAGWPDYQHIENGICTITQDTAKMSFASLWESINGQGSWGTNPLVWVVKFQKNQTMTNINAINNRKEAVAV